MKKNKLINIFLLFISLNIYSTESLKVLILPFKNNTNNTKNDIYVKIIEDTIVNDLNIIPVTIEKTVFDKNILSKIKSEDDKDFILSFYKLDILGKNYSRNIDMTNIEDIDKIQKIFNKIGFNKFIPIILKNFNNTDDVPDYNSVYNKAFFNSIDLILFGFYFEDRGQIRITFKILDVLTDRIKIIHTKFGSSGYNTFDIILDSVNEFVNLMNKNINPYPEDLNSLLRIKQGRVISGEIIDRFIFLNIGACYSGIGFYNKSNLKTNKINLQNDKNIYYNSVNPSLNIEIYGSYKNNYHGFGLKLILPFIYFVPNMQMLAQVGIGYNFGYKKIYFFSWNLNLFYRGYNKYNNNGNQEIMVLYIGTGLGFNFKYMPLKYPFFIEIGSSFVPPFLPFLQNNKNMEGPSFCNISSNLVSNKNWIMPVIFNSGIGYFIKDNFGIYLKNNLYFMNISYEKYDYQNNNIIKYGEEFAVIFDIDIGFVFKEIFK